jgi:hypothetical protein
MTQITLSSAGILFLLLAACTAAPVTATAIPTETNTATPAETATPTTSETPEPTLTPTPFVAVISEDRSPCIVSAPPTGYGEWFTKYCDAGGIPILASKYVSDIAVQQAYYVATNFFAPIPDHRQTLADAGVKFIIYDLDHETILDIPSTRLFDFTIEASGVYIPENNFTVSFENDLLCMYGLKNLVAIHELAHALELVALQDDEDWMQARISAYGNSKNHDVWTHSYAMTNPAEYWAEAVTAYFGVYWDPGNANERIDREEFETYDPKLFALVEQTFRGFVWEPTCP